MSEVPTPEKTPNPVLLDGIERLQVAQSDYFNEIRSLRTLIMGLRQIYGMINSREAAFARAGGDKYKVVVYGPAE